MFNSNEGANRTEEHASVSIQDSLAGKESCNDSLALTLSVKE